MRKLSVLRPLGLHAAAKRVLFEWHWVIHINHRLDCILQRHIKFFGVRVLGFC